MLPMNSCNKVMYPIKLILLFAVYREKKLTIETVTITQNNKQKTLNKNHMSNSERDIIHRPKELP